MATARLDAGGPRSRVTAADVARRAGVSRACVSQVLNGTGDRFAEETRVRVRSAAEELGYRPSQAGRALRSGRSQFILVLAPHISWGRNLQDAVEHLEADLEGEGLSVVIQFEGGDDGRSLRQIQDLQPVAVIDLGVLSPSARTLVVDQGWVLLPEGPGPDDAGLMPAVGSAYVGRIVDVVNYGVGWMQAEHLLSRGYRRLGYARLVDDRRDMYGPPRLRAARDFCQEHGLGELVELDVPLDPAGGLASLAALPEGPGIGLACFNDDVAIAALAALRRSGREAGVEVGVVGCDNSAVGQLVHPRLATVEINLQPFIDETASAIKRLVGSGVDVPVRSYRDMLRLVPGDSA